MSKSERMTKAEGRGRRGEGRQRIYDRLRQDILSLRLEPGSTLDEAELAAAFGVSRTPMREALIWLSVEGLVQLQQNRGARVAPMDIHNLREHHEALEMLHRVVARWAATRVTDEGMRLIVKRRDDFEAAVSAGNGDKVLEANVAFHAAIGEEARNSYIQAAYVRILNEGQRYSRISLLRDIGTDAENQAAVISEHRDIVTALEARDADAADHAALVHARNGRARLMQYLSASGAADVPLSQG